MSNTQPGILVCIGGFPGSGKTTAGLRLLEWLGESTRIVEPDLTRAEVLGRREDSSIGNADLTPEITAKTIERMAEKTAEGLTEGQVVVVPSAFILPAMRAQFQKMAENSQAPFYGFWLDCPADVRKQRMDERLNRRESGTVDITTTSTVTHAHQNVDPGKIDWEIIDGSQSREHVFEAIARRLSILVPQAQRNSPKRNCSGPEFGSR
jgi:predicted kinase